MVKPTLKHYIEFLYPGILFDETVVREVESRNSSEIALPRGSFGYRFFDRTEVRSGRELLIGEPKNYSGTTYLGRVMTLEDVQREVPNSDILQGNMSGNGWNKVVKPNFDSS